MDFRFAHLDQTANYLTFIFLFLIFAAVGFGVWLFFKRNFCRIVFSASAFSAIIFWGFSLDAVFYTLLIAMVVEFIVFYIANPNENREYIANNMVGKANRLNLFARKKNHPEALFDRDAVYRKVLDAVTRMSKQKVGAIISFEKRDSLDEVMKSGTKINAPVSSELLQTIFYPGTRLHDGAVIIRNDMIVAASVYYTPTTRPLTGKFGSRHRAAIGISETTDAVTVVVSEETGRISIAYEGELRAVGPDEFLNVFEDYMAIVESKPKDEEAAH
jgi:uncharacterized protein (TIGR00159 family)